MPEKPTAEKLLSTSDVAEILGLSREAAYSAMKEMRTIQIGHGTKRPRLATTMSAIVEWQQRALQHQMFNEPVLLNEQKKPHRRNSVQDPPEGWEYDPRTGKLRIARKRA